MDGVGEIDGRRVPGQGDNFSFGRERVDLFGIQIDFQAAEKIRRILHVLLQLNKLAKPRNSLVFTIVRNQLTIFIFPVSCNAFFGEAVHFRCSDLHFEGLAAGNDGSMQRLVHVWPRHRDEVLNAAGHRSPGVVNHA